MGIFSRFTSDGEEDKTEVETDPLFSPSEDASAEPDDGPDTEFAIDMEEAHGESKQGKELLVIDPETDDAYAGEWPRTLMEGARQEPRQPIWVGYTEPDPLHGPREVPLEFNSLFRHVAMFGSTGFGKSTVLKNMMIQWAFGGHGFCYIDPKGDDSEELVQMLPEERLDDIIWIEPSPKDFDKVVGINFLDPSKEYGEDGFEKEASNIIADIIPILRDESFWGPRMDEVVRGFLRAMLYLGAKDTNDESYTLVDLYKLLTEKELRASFAEKIEQNFGASEDILQNAVEKFAEIDDSDLASARRRLQSWVIDRNIQQVIAHTESKVNITKAVEDGKIIIVRTASISDQSVQRGVATVVIRRIWAAIQMRSDMPQEERDPYFLCVDEFDDVVSGESDIGRILSKARSLRLGTVVANQQPHQLSKEVQDSVFGNCNTLLALNPKHPDDAHVISKSFDTDMSNIIGLGRFQICTKILVDNEPSDVFLTHTFAEYPPKRPLEDAKELIAGVVEEYGVAPIKNDANDVEDSKFDPSDDDNKASETGEELHEVSDQGDMMTVPEVLRCIYTAQIRKSDPSSFVTVTEVKDIIQEHADGNASYNRVSNVLTEKLDDAYIEKQMVEDVEIRLSSSGQQKAFTQDTGDSASAGKEKHRYLLQLAHETFVRLGYDFEADEQVGGRQPDAIASPPINIFEEANSAREMQKLTEKFDNEYPHISEVFGHDELSIEVEKATESKPKQPIKNLVKAVENGQDCVFVVPDGKLTKDSPDDFSVHANRMLNILRSPPFISGFIEKEDGGQAYRHFYNDNPNVKIEGRSQMFALKPDTSDAVWKEDPETGELILESPEDGDDPHVVLDSVDDIKNPKKEDFPLTYHYDQSQEKVIISDEHGDKVDEFTRTNDKKPTRVMKDNGYQPISMPYIPEHQFPNNELPDEDQWHIVVLPSSERNYGPRYYDFDEGELRPLFEDDMPLSTDKIVDPAENDTEVNNTGNDEPQTPQDVREATEQSELSDLENDSDTESTEEDGRPKVSDGTKPKSTAEVVKESGEEWVQPEPGDDDYDPAKDNSNYRTGYNEEYTDAEWTGGDARDLDKEGDFDEYVPPSERDNNTEETTDEQQEEEPLPSGPMMDDSVRKDDTEVDDGEYEQDDLERAAEEKEQEQEEDEVVTTEDVDRDELVSDNEEEDDEDKPPSVADLLGQSNEDDD